MTKYTACPIFDLDDFILEHWDRNTLCASFDCEVCVATPEDFGYTGEVIDFTEQDIGEIPF